MRRPCETVEMIQKENGNFKSVKHYSYVALLTEIEGDQVQAVRYDGYTSKEAGLIPEIEQDYPGWKIKGIWKLYDTDFRAE
jgi:hypothetical protein